MDNESKEIPERVSDQDSLTRVMDEFTKIGEGQSVALKNLANKPLLKELRENNKPSTE